MVVDIVFDSLLGIGLTYMLVWRRIYVAKSVGGGVKLSVGVFIFTKYLPIAITIF